MARRPAELRGGNRLGGALAGWVDGARRHAGWIVLGSALFTVACALYAARNLGVETDTEALFDPELRFRRLESQLDAAFPMREDALIVVLDAPDAGRAGEAAEALAARLAAEPGLYADVFAPGVGPFFARHGLLYQDLDETEELVDRLASAQPFLAEVSRDPSLRGLFRMFERALDQATAAAERGLDLEKALAEVELAAREAARRRVRHVGFDQLLVSSGGEGATRRYVLVQPRIDYSELVPARDALERLRATLVELGFGPGGDVRARFTGNLALSAEELEITRRQSALAGAISFVLVTAILSLALRSPRLVAATMATLAAGLVWTGAFAALAIGRLNMVSLAFAVLFIGLGVDFGIHTCLRYRELRARGEEHAAALRETAAGVGSSLVLCALTTATGFYAFVPTGYTGVAELGVVAGTGMFVSLFASLTLLPALLSVAGGATSSAPPASDRFATFQRPARHPRWVVGCALALAVVGAALAPRVRFDGNPLRVRDPSAESVQTFQELVSEGDLNPWSAEVLAPSLAQAEALSERLLGLPGVDRSITLADYVPSQQDAKRALLADASFLLHLTPPHQRRPAPSRAEERAALDGFRASLHRAGAVREPSRVGLARRCGARRPVGRGGEGGRRRASRATRRRAGDADRGWSRRALGRAHAR